MNKGGSSGFKYLAIAIVFSIIVGSFYLIILNHPSRYVPDFSTIRFVKIISNKDGKVHKLLPEHVGPLNYAYRKMGTSSKTFISGGVHGGFRATDGNLRGTFVHTEDIEQAYVDVDLNMEVNVLSVRLYNRDDEYASRIIPFKIFLGRTPFKNEGTIKDSEKNCLAQIMYNETKTIYTWILDKHVPARYVRVQLMHKNFLHFYELEVYDSAVKDDYVFTSNYVQYRAEPPIIPLPTTFPTFIPMAGQILNISNPKRAFTHHGAEINAENYVQILFSSPSHSTAISSTLPELYISDGANFVGELRVCMVFLCTDGSGYNTNADYLTEVIINLEVLSENFFTVYQYDVIIFYSWSDPSKVTENKERVARKFPYLTVRFVDVSRYFPPTLPQHLIDNNVDMTLYQKGSDCAPGNHWKLNYLHMGRFWSTKLWLEPILQEYDIIWRLDADATIDVPVKQSGGVNFLREMKARQAMFGYWNKFSDTPECDSGIAEAVEDFAKRKGLSYKQNKVPKHTAYWGGFGVYATEFFCKNQNWIEFVDYLDSLGGHYNHRWGEQNVFPHSLALFLESHELYHVTNNDVKVFHDHQAMSNKV